MLPVILLLTSCFVSGAADLPTSVDNSRSRYFPTIISQVGGSCAQASYIGYMFSYEMNRLLDRDGSLDSNCFSYLYTWNLINDGEDVGSYGFDGLSLAMDNGVALASDFPNQVSSYAFRWMSGFDKYLRAASYRIKTMTRMDAVSASDIEKIKSYLYDHGEPGTAGGVVTFSSMATDWKFNNSYAGPSETGYHSILTSLATKGGHAMTIVGYDDLVEFDAPDGTVSKGAFIVANTWGTYSHDNGRYYLPYWFFLQADRDSNVLSHDVVAINVEHRQPTVVFRVEIECDARDNISFRTGAANGAGAKTPTVDYQKAVFNHQGGSYNMQGQTASATAELGLDFTSADRFTADWDRTTWFLTVNSSQRSGKKASVCRLRGFSVYDYRENPSAPKVYTADLGGVYVDLAGGDNVFTVSSADPYTTSYTPVDWLGDGGAPLVSPFIFRTADGRNSFKVKFVEYDRESGTMRLKYQKL